MMITRANFLWRLPVTASMSAQAMAVAIPTMRSDDGWSRAWRKRQCFQTAGFNHLVLRRVKLLVKIVRVSRSDETSA